MNQTRKPVTTARAGARLCALILLLLGGALSPARAALPALATLDEVTSALPHADLSGRVLDPAGAPVPDAEIFVYYQRGNEGIRDRLAGRTRTDAQGRFSLEKIIVWEPVSEIIGHGESRYGVFARHPRHGINFTVIEPGRPTHDLTINLAGMTWATPKVVDGAGKPLAGARVTLAFCEQTTAPKSYFRMHRDIGLSSGVTGPDGTVRLPAIGECSFFAVKEGFADGFQNDIKNAIVMNRSGARVSGVVSDPEGRPVPGAAIFFTYESKADSVFGAVVADRAGRYEIKDAPCAGYHYSWSKVKSGDEPGTLTLTADDLRPRSPLVADPVAFTLAPGQQAEKKLRLKRGVVLAGTVVDIITGEPIPLLPLSPLVGDHYLPDRLTDEQGAFQVKFHPGSQVHLSWDRSSGGKTLIERQWLMMDHYYAFNGVMNEDRTGLKLKLKRWQVSPLHGRAVDPHGRGLAGAMVYFHGGLEPVPTGPDGAFTLETGPDDRDFDLYAVSRDGVLAGLEHCKAGTKEVTLKLAPALRFRGQVRDTLGEPAGDLKFSIQPELNGAGLYRLFSQVQAGADGTFTTPPLHPRTRLEVRWESSHTTNRDYSDGICWLEPGELKEGEPIRLTASRHINALMGKVTDDAGRPIANASFAIEPENTIMREARRALAQTGKDGSFTIRQLAEGEVTLVVAAPGAKTRALRVATDNVDCVVKLRRPGAATTGKVAVVDETRKPIAGAPVTLWLKVKTGATVTSSVQTQKSDARGECRFTWPALSAGASGEGLVGADVPGKAWAFAGVDLTRDEDLLLVARRTERPPYGRIVDIGGRPVAGARLRLAWINNPSGSDKLRHANVKAHVGEFLELETRTDAAGRYAWPRLGAEDQLTMEASAAGMATSKITQWNESSPGEHYLMQPSGRLRVRLSADGAPSLEGATAYLYHSFNRLDEPGTPYRVGAGGVLELSGMQPRKYWIKSVIQAGKHYVSSNAEMIEVQPGELATAEPKLEESVLLKGRLIDAKTGKAPASAVWIMVERSGDFSSHDGIHTDAEGHFEFHLPVGKFDLSCMLPGMRHTSDIRNVNVERALSGRERTFKVAFE